MQTEIELPKYQCHKIVRALKIAAIEILEDGTAKIAPEDSRYAPCTVNFGSNFKGSEEDKGYYVVYEDGYVSWSPTKAFEEGYSLIN